MNDKEKVDRLISFAKSKLGCLYIWGANGPTTFDCSGFVLAALREAGIYHQNFDLTAQDIYYFLSNENFIQKLDRGAILFFGRSKQKITHTGIALDTGAMIHAGGGNRHTTTEAIARKLDACVKVSNIRKDLVAYLSIS